MLVFASSNMIASNFALNRMLPPAPLKIYTVTSLLKEKKIHKYHQQNILQTKKIVTESCSIDTLVRAPISSPKCML